jgi:hypothetical protein
MAPTTRSRAAAESALKHKAAPKTAESAYKIEPKAIKTEILETANVQTASKLSPSSKSKSKRVTKRIKKSTQSLTSRPCRKQPIKKEEPLENKSLMKNNIKEEEYQEGKTGGKTKEKESKKKKAKKRNPIIKRSFGIYGEGESWLLCEELNIWIHPNHPLY